MQLMHKIRSLERDVIFRDRSERWLFWHHSALNLRHLAVCLGIVGFAAWTLSRIFAQPGPPFDVAETIMAVAGMLIGWTTVYFSRGAVTHSIGCSVFVTALALGLHGDVVRTSNPEFWTIPLGIVITLGMVAVFADYYSYFICNMIVWFIIARNEVDLLLNLQDLNWIIIAISSGITLGFLLNYLFVQERKKVFLVQRELIKLAFKDALTGIDNRRSLMESMQDHHARAATDDFYLLLIDIDDFKRVNDTLGHDVGDQVLVAVAAVIDRCAQMHTFGRLGGEEFGVIFAGEEGAACALAQRLCENVAKSRISTHAVTISIGLSKFYETVSLADIFRTADQGLYEAKRQGKNRYVLIS
ncbi:GGDEF domain-containing protein [Paraburkholderia fungorum]|nr:GGDEF domain-containing protein [Paraburkholderia fungorum]